jgi:hypothetical protein
MRIRRSRCRRGVALVAALALLTLSGIVVAALVASSITAQRAMRLGRSGATALASADFAVSTVLGDPAGYALATLPLGVVSQFDVVVAQASPIHVAVAVTRLPSGVLWFVADAAVAGIDSGERRINLVAQFPNIAPLPPAGIESRGDVSLGPDVTISTDTSDDVECAAHVGGPSVVSAPGAKVDAPPGVSVETLVSATDSNSYLLTARQRAILAAATGVTHVHGDTTIAGGSVDGILLVDGALTIAGSVTVNGLVVATGPIRTVAGGALGATGAVVSAHFGPGPAFDLKTATIRFNPCVVAAVLRRAAPPLRVRDRGWAELF